MIRPQVARRAAVLHGGRAVTAIATVVVLCRRKLGSEFET